jgi:hypothetical protein
VFFLILLSFIVALAARTPGLADEKEKTDQERSLGPLEKSLIVPGWGQFAEKRFVEGAAFLGAELFCLAEIFLSNHHGNENYSLYKQAATTEDAVRYRQLTEKYDTRRNQFLLAAAAVWAANLVDIYLIVRHKAKKESAFQIRIGRGEHQKIFIMASYGF